MRLGIFVPYKNQEHYETLMAFSNGIRIHGDTFFTNDILAGYKQCDVAVTFGIPKHATSRGQLVERIWKSHGDKPRLVIEKGFVKRNEYYMVGFGGLNGRASYNNEGSPADRWKQLGVELQPWKEGGEYILVCGQVPWDASVQHTDYKRWVIKTLIRLPKFTDIPIVFRPHPLQKTAIDVRHLKHVKIDCEGTLQEAVQKAATVVTFNSNSGVEAVIEGVPVVTCDKGSMVYEIANNDIERVDNPLTPARRAWAYNLAYTQWTRDEMKKGLPWGHLRDANLG